MGNIMATVINDVAGGEIEHVEVDAALGERWLMQPDAFESLTCLLYTSPSPRD